MGEFFTFLGKLRRKLWALLSCAIFTGVSVLAAYYSKSNLWIFRTSVIVAGLCVLIACYQVWRDEYKEAAELRQEFPKIRIDLIRSTWLTFKLGRDPIIDLFVYARLTNLGRADTTIQQYVLSATGLDGTSYNCTFDPRIPRKQPSLVNLVSVDTPLRRGLHVEGWLRFYVTLVGSDDPCPDKRRLIFSTELTVTDAFGADHTTGQHHMEVPHDEGFGTAARAIVL